MSLGRSLMVRRFRFHSNRLFVEALEDRTLLSFLPPVSYATGFHPFSVAVGDFNGDGFPDLAVANPGNDVIPGTVSILLGNGDGTFQTAHSYAAGSYAISVAVGDFNGDGHLDLAVTNSPGFSSVGTVRVLLGNGDGTFQTAHSYADGFPYATSVAVGDFDGDGHLDLAVTGADGQGNGTESVLLGKGDGTFQPPVVYYSTTTVTSVAVGDFNGDGFPDLAVAGYDGNSPGMVSVLLGKGDGTFQAAHNYAVGFYSLFYPSSVAVGDFDGDGHLDLAVAGSDYYGNGSVSVLLGKGDGTFQATQDYSTGRLSNSVAVGDFDGDGHLDIAVANHESNTVSVLLGKGDGTFQTAQSYAAGSIPSSVAVGDFNGDGFPDLAVTNGDGVTVASVTVLLNAADWAGGPGATPPGRSGVHRPIPSQPQEESVVALLVASKPETVSVLPRTFTDLLPNLARQWPLKMETGQSADLQATFSPRSIATPRHAQDAVVNGSDDGLLDVLAWNLLR